MSLLNRDFHIDNILDQIDSLRERISILERTALTSSYSPWVYLEDPLTSTDFDGDLFSTTSKTLIDLSSSFGVPAGAKAVLINVSVRDSASASNVCWMMLSPEDSAGEGLIARCSGVADNYYQTEVMIVPCDINGDIYYQVQASGASTLTASIKIWGYMI